MPNSTPDPITSQAPEAEELSPRPTSAPLSESQPQTLAPASHPQELNAVDEAQDAQPDASQSINARPESEHAPDPLTTSLASPGRVESDEKTWHNSTEEPDPTELNKSEVSSEAPSHANRHLSMMSFTRTVSEEVNWGEDDEVDSQWNLQKTDTDPFQSMTRSDGTNSFPQVLPTHSLGSHTHDQPLAHNQVDDIMNEVAQEIPKDLFGGEENDPEADFFAQGLNQLRSDKPFEQGNEAGDDNQTRLSFHGQTCGGDVQPEEAEASEARYNEGLPLVQQKDEGVPAQSSGVNDPFATFDADEEDFFAQVNKGEDDAQDPEGRPPLQRKSTSEVMDSLHYQPHEQTHEPIREEARTASSQSQPALSINNNIAVSSSTIVSADGNLAEQSGGREAEEGDLAAKWEAALAGDEFLADDDDELLPDDDDDEPVGNTGFDPATVFGSDDEGFLEDDDQGANDLFSQQTSASMPAPVTITNGHVAGNDSFTGAAQRPTSSSNKYLPTGAATAPAPASRNSYAPVAPLYTDLSQSNGTGVTPSPYMSPPVSNFQPTPARPEMPKAQSFADKSKGGYASPYDLPMEVVKPRKRVSMAQMNRPAQFAVDNAPPRSSSMYNAAPRGPSSSVSPPTSSHAQQGGQQPSVAQQPPRPQTLRHSQSGFFEELPMSRPKQVSRNTTALVSSVPPSPYGPPGAMPPPLTSPARNPYAPPAIQQQPIQQRPVQPPPQVQGLIAPERVSPYTSLPTGNVPTVSAARYSPAPPPLLHSQTAPSSAAQSRYSPAPPGQRAGSYTVPGNAQPAQPAPMLPHQPRTSSPLAYFERNHESRFHGSFSEGSNGGRRASSSGYDPNPRTHPLPSTKEVEENIQLSPRSTRQYGELPQNHTNQQVQPSMTRTISTPPPPQALASRFGSSPPKRALSNYQPQPTAYGPPQPFVPPERSQTQSPGSAFAGSKFEMTAPTPYQRPASVEAPTSPRVGNAYHPMPSAASTGRPRGFSTSLSYVAPTDGRENDPLQRWRGAPVFAWGVGGTIVTSFPQEIPRYGMNAQAMIIRSPGTVKIKSIKDVDPLQEHLASFPGPLKGKSKKKDVLAWLASGIEVLEQNASYMRTVQTLSHEDKRVEERVLLWKILRVFIEHDGTLEGSAVVDQAVRAVLSPGLDEDQGASGPLYATGADLSGIQQSSSTASKTDPVDPAAVDQLRKHLLRGDREKAVWDAVDKRLWAHALLISNTVSRDLYKRVAQEFVQKEVKIIGDNVEPLAALYEIFAGNFEESIDELVPPSARAGCQMVSTSQTTGPSKDAMDGLDRWRETIGLVLSNRSTDDSQALKALGKLLSGYGRAEAAHICFLFARSLSIFGGIDDPQASIVLVGSDQLRQPFDFDRELEPILLSEVFEYGATLSSNSNVAISSPHLAVYKLQHAKILAEYGFIDKALQYCESIAASVTSQTRRSPYHHSLLVSELEDLSKRLKHSPKDGTTSWISKPSMDKAKGSVWATFNKFVAGDEADSAASGSSAGNAPDVGPFSRIASGTPTISRSPSFPDVYGAQNGSFVANGSAPMAVNQASSRYAPGASSYVNHEMQSGASYGSQPRTSLEERPSGEFRRYDPPRQTSDYGLSSHLSNLGNSYTPQVASFVPQSPYTPYGNPGSSYEPSPNYAPQNTVTEPAPTNMYPIPQPLNSFDSQQPSSGSSDMQQSASNIDSQASNSFDSPSAGYQPPASASYEAPSYEPQGGGYEPPTSSYVPYEPKEPDSPVETKPKKKSFMDDDDDDIPGLKAAPASREKTKAEKDREADEAFRKAAEADGEFYHLAIIIPTNTPLAQKAKEAAPAKKGWGLGWFGGGSKKEAQDTAAAPNKPIKAKLGEASSFYYDPELKRWVNKKAGADDVQAKSSTPPPPRSAGPPRTSSAPMQAPPGASPPTAGPPTSGPRPMPIGGAPQMLAQRAVSDNTHMGFPPSPQSDDGITGGGGLSAPPPLMNRSQSNSSLRGSGPPSAPPSRPSTSMSNASSIDDLLGPAVPRKAGGAAAKKGAKKKTRYVDVMGDKAS